jgi:3-deoxy-7-phosphoheptulonate synthase
MHATTSDLHVVETRPLVPPALLHRDLPISDRAAETVQQARQRIQAILQGRDRRLLVIVGPCSVHDVAAAKEYATFIAEARRRHAADLEVVMRVYFEKPRTTVGWKGLINDPHLDGSFSINEGLHAARRFLLGVLDLGLAAASECLDPNTPQVHADLVSWGAIGARTSESQVHRELASGLSMPVGFKNGTGGSVQIAVDAIGSAANPHHFLSVTKQGVAAIVATKGNDACHLILRGGKTGPNYDTASVEAAIDALESAGLRPRLMVDCSHANSGKDHRMQPEVAREIAARVADGNDHVFGLMLESFLVEGNQSHSQEDAATEHLTRGQSITDKCMSWEQTAPLFDELAEAVRKRRG